MDENCRVEIVNNSLHLQQIELTQKCISLQVLKDLLEANNKTISQKKETLRILNNDLDNLHHAVWLLQSQSCDNVWDFSSKHDFNAILNNYPEISYLTYSNCNCELQDVKTMQQDVEAQKILIEINKLESDLEIANCNTLKSDLMRANEELYECENEISEIERLKESITESKQRIEKLKSRSEFQPSGNEISWNDFTSRNVHVLSEDNIAYSSPDSSIRDPSLEKIDCNLHFVQPAILSSNNIKRKWTDFSDASSSNAKGFIKASTLMESSENQTQFKNTPLCEKIIAEAVSNEKKYVSSTSVEKSRKKFVPKTQSLITRRLKH